MPYYLTEETGFEIKPVGRVSPCLIDRLSLFLASINQECKFRPMQRS